MDLLKTREPTYRQCFSTRRDSAIFSPISVQTGFESAILAKSAFTAKTLPPVDSEPMLTISVSLFASLATFQNQTQNDSFQSTVTETWSMSQRKLWIQVRPNACHCSVVCDENDLFPSFENEKPL